GGRRFGARAVVDGTGRPPEGRFMLGYQKFVGLELELAEPHGLDAPIIMDARVEQQDGYRFVYVLPFSPTSVLVEDTYYSDTSGLDRDVVRQRVRAYVSARGWPVRRILREEAQRVLADYQRRRQEAEKEAEEIVRNARAEAERLAADAQQKLSDFVASRQRMAEQKIAQAEAQATAEVRAAAAEAAVRASETILRREVAGTTAEGLITQGLKDVRAKLN
ncbi:lycopene cyclase family protein, partial [Nostoc sp. NIES-2111]